MYCSNIQSVDLGENIKLIDDNAFYDCALIKKLEIGSNVTYIGKKHSQGVLLLKNLLCKQMTKVKN